VVVVCGVCGVCGVWRVLVEVVPMTLFVAPGQEEARGEGELAAHETVVRSQVRVPAAYSDQLRPLTQMCVSRRVCRVSCACVSCVSCVSCDIGIDSQATGAGSRKRRGCSCF
jgi:hypothetical protein